jgi:hypothetical protein
MTAYSFSQLIDFTRTSSGTFVGSNGLIQTTPQSRNLLTFTQEFDNAAWSKANTTVTANSTAAPDGTSTADTLTAGAGAAGGQQVYQALTTVGAGSFVYSVYIKKGSGATDSNKYTVRNNTAAANFVELTVNYDTGVVTQTTGSGAAMANVGNNWWRLTMPFTSTATLGNEIRFYVGSIGAAETPGEFCFAWGAQLEQASTATDYTRNVGGLFPARFDYDPVTLAPRGILIEEQRVNLALHSEDYTNAAWTKGGVTVAADTTASPSGAANADKLVEDTSTGDHRTFQPISITNGVSYAISAYVKAAGRTRVQLTMQGIIDGGATYDLSTGTVVGATSGTASITALGNGWFRVVLVNVSTVTTSTNLQVRLVNTGTNTSYTGDGTSGIFLWGTQLETGAFATSYIQTVASQVTRTADQASIVAPMFAPWYNTAAGTFVFEGTALAASGFAWPFSASAGSAANAVSMYRSAAFVAGFIANTSVTQLEITSSPVVANVPYKAAVAAETNNGNFSFNGNIGTNDTTITMPTVNRLSLGANAAGSAEFLNGHIRRVTYYPTRLSDLQLQALTA